VGYSPEVEFRISAARAERLQEEREAQRAWVLKNPAFAPFIDALLQREFLEPQSASDIEAVELQRIIAFAKSQVPFYREDEGWRQFRADQPVDRQTLASLPVIGKTQLRENFDAFNATRLPANERITLETSSSGTTGTPVRVRFSRMAGMAFAPLSQRLHRWARFDPMRTQAVIRQARVLPKNKDGTPLKDGEVQRLGGWMYARDWFHTGSQVSITRGNPLDFQMEWLRAERPAYLVTSPGLLESLVYAAQGKPVDSLQGLRAIAATLTEDVRQQIESATNLAVQQPYGLNEIGAVASRCAAGRYHANAEHCVMEVVDEDHQPCHPGEFGRVLVTALTNVAMPLIRYDTGDIAEAVSGDCPCGRTMPGIGRIQGRYRPMRFAPEGTTMRMDLLFNVLRTQQLDALRNLREYQLHQFRDGRFELRLAMQGAPDARLVNALREAWDREAGDAVLEIVQVEAIPRIAGRKTQDFTSEFFPSNQEGTRV
jgi:phenylacetate-CoA ligase